MERIIGKKAPQFRLKAVSGDGEDFFDVSLDTYKGHWLVLFFYPMDFTFVCPTEITRFSEDFHRFEAAGAKILAVSADSEYCHQAWIRNGLGQIRYPLAADKTMSTALDYGVLLEDEGITLRGLFIIDPEQTIRYSVIHDNNIGRSTDEVLRVLNALRTNSLCGANWSIGSKPLLPSETVMPELVQTKGQIRIYTMPGCVYCKQIKAMLADNNLTYDEINLETDRDGQAFMEARGYTALPVTVIGSHEISGYRLDKIKQALRETESESL